MHCLKKAASGLLAISSIFLKIILACRNDFDNIPIRYIGENKKCGDSKSGSDPFIFIHGKNITIKNMNITNKVYKKTVQRIRSKLKKVNSSRFRVSIYRSSKNISAQIIDDRNNKTLVSASSLKEKNNTKVKKTDMSMKVAEILSKKALDKKITKVYFDRGRYKYHGRIKLFAEALRKGGLTF